MNHGTVVLSILEDGADLTARRIAATPSGCGLLEIRADTLRASDVPGLLRRADRPSIVTVRGREEGGLFDGSAEERRAILEAGLRGGAAFVDLPFDGPPEFRPEGLSRERTLLSHHGARCDRDVLLQLLSGLIDRGAARYKIVPKASSPTDIVAVRDLLREADRRGHALAAFASGASGTPSRVLALAWGAWGVFAAPRGGTPTAEGQIVAEDLLEIHDPATISASTRLFGLVGSPVLESPSPAMHSSAYRAAGVDARLVPMETERADEAADLVTALDLRGLAVTIPLKERVASRCQELRGWAAACGAVNTVRIDGGRWLGHNTDAPAALSLLRPHIDPRGAKIAVVGAGGTARAIASALSLAGADVVLFGRSEPRARAAAVSLGVGFAPLASIGDASWDVLVQATPLGRRGEMVLPAGALRGRVVLEAAYGPRETPLARDAGRRGLVVVDGRALLVAQAVLQIEILTGIRASGETLADAIPRPLASDS